MDAGWPAAGRQRHAEDRAETPDRQFRRLVQRVRQLRHLLPGVWWAVHPKAEFLCRPRVVARQSAKRDGFLHHQTVNGLLPRLWVGWRKRFTPWRSTRPDRPRTAVDGVTRGWILTRVRTTIVRRETAGGRRSPVALHARNRRKDLPYFLRISAGRNAQSQPGSSRSTPRTYEHRLDFAARDTC